MIKSQSKSHRPKHGLPSGCVVGNVISATTWAYKVNDLVDYEYLIVGTKAHGTDTWFYGMNRKDLGQFRRQCSEGDIISARRLNDDGSCIVFAKLATPENSRARMR